MPDPGARDAAPFEGVVALPRGRVWVRVDRRALELPERGGFEAAWADPDAPPSWDREAFRTRVRDHLRACALARDARGASAVLLNLAAHRLVDDVEGWTHLNPPGRDPFGAAGGS